MIVTELLGSMNDEAGRALVGRRHVEHVDHAETSGAVAGRNMTRPEEEREVYDHTPLFFSDLFDDGYEAVGNLDTSLETVEVWNEDRTAAVVHYLDDGAVEGDLGQAGGHRGAGRAAAEVVPVERHVHLTDGGGGVEGRLDAGQQGAEPPGQGGPAARDPHQDETLGALVGLEDLVGDPGQRPVDLGRGQHGPGSTRCGGISSHAGASFPASQDGS